MPNRHIAAKTIWIILICRMLTDVALADLKVLDRPMCIFPGQTFRVALEQPSGSGELRVEVPTTLEMFDRWSKDAIQRFYFRAAKKGDATLRFQGKGGELELSLEVVPWVNVFEQRKFKNIRLPRIWPLDAPSYRQLKNRRTLHSEEEVNSLRGRRPGPLAQQWSELSDEQIFDIVPGPCVPRTCLMMLGGYEEARGKGCPVCGTKIYEGRSYFYPWLFDPKNHPWKVGCPSCGNWFPSNDFQNGDMHSGDFPDDGFGCEPVKPVLAPNGKPWRWPFIAYYHEWPAYMNNFMAGIPQCAEAFIATGEKRYAHKASIGLLRLAESLLDMAVNLNHRKIPVRNGLYQPPVGAPETRAQEHVSHTFLYIQPNWDTPRLERCAKAWDLIFDQLAGDQELISFCQKHHHPEIRSVKDFRRFVEAGLIRVTVQACLDDAVSRNYPMQEATIATMALALNTPRCEELVDWVLNGPGGIRFGLTNEYFKDGAGHESESYNRIQIRDMTRIFLTLERIRELDPERYRPPRFVSPLTDPKFRQIYEFPVNNSLIGRTYPSTGDCGSPGTDPWPLQEGFPLSREEFVEVFRRTRDRRFAQVLGGPDGKIPVALHEPELRAEVEKIGRERGWQVTTRSNICDGFGHAFLRSGEGHRQRALWLRYGRTLQHAHSDMLTFGLEALQRKMLPELGYPQGWTYASSWETNWGTHYGTHIVGFSTRSFGRGRLTLFADSGPARVAVAESSGDNKTWRQRTIVLVDLPQENCYAVTLERVRGGTTHLHSFHGPDGRATTLGLDLQPQKGGTILGADSKYGDDSSIKNIDRELSCLAFMYGVEHDRPAGVWSLDYTLRGQKDVHLRMTMTNPTDADLTVAKGKAPGGGKNPYEMTWALLERKGQIPLASQFLLLLEPYEGAPSIQRIERIKISSEENAGQFVPLAVRVTTAEFVDTLIFQPNQNTVCKTQDGLVCDGEFGFWRERHDGQRAAAVLAHGQQLHKGEHRLSLPKAQYNGRIERCDWSRHKLVLKPAPPRWKQWPGQHLQIHNDRGSHASYLIRDARMVPDGCEIILGLDPRIGEGFVRECQDGALISHVPLRMASLKYYAGKTLANENGSAVYRLADVEERTKCIIEKGVHGQVTAARLEQQFRDTDGDGLPRYLIYDYGPGDLVTLKYWTSVAKNAAD
ncbi:MAG: hypothetical protein ACYTEK_00920 [Planctomycetota bacterium]